MHGEAPQSYITGVPGWETPAEQDLLVQLAREAPADGVIVEIGCEYGMSTSLLLTGSNRQHGLYSVDNFHDAKKNIFFANLAEAGLAARSHLIQADSGAAGRNWVGGDISLLFIDGDHSYAGVKRDIETWTGYIKPGGRVAFHDCACMSNTNPHPLHYEVTKAVNEWFMLHSDQWSFVTMVDSIMVFQRDAYA